jgi:hypothetical protein
MRPGFRHIWTALALFISIAPGISRADVGWPEAVGRLAGERSKAETCAALLKGYGDQQQSAGGQLAYGEAKANFDAVIALITALTEGGAPKSLPSLETDLEHGAASLGKFCKMVSDVLPSTSGRDKGILDDIAKGAIQPVVDALSEGVAALYNNHRKDRALARETIKTQLEATKWPNFAEVKAAK